MNLNEYQPYWDAAAPLMHTKLEELRALLAGKTPYSIGAVTSDTEADEFRLIVDLSRDEATVLGVEFVLTDSDVRDCDPGDPAVGIRLDLVGHGGLVLGGYAPGNYTPDAFTCDIEEVRRRVDALPVVELADYIRNTALQDKRLKDALAQA